MTQYRTETDTFGEIQVDSSMLYGAQTQRSLINFAIGEETMPKEVINALVYIKKSAALTNNELKKLDDTKKDLILAACDEILSSDLYIHFPLKVWQTGSGTQTNMNVNEVISNICSKNTNQPLGSKKPIHPNDDVNMSQSSNDSFPTAMNIASVLFITTKLLPAIKKLEASLEQKVSLWKDIIKIGRTHCQDATPVTLGQEFSGYKTQISNAYKRIENTLYFLSELAQGGTAVGTGINSHKDFSSIFIKHLNTLTSYKKFTSAPNKFEALACNDSMVELSGSLSVLASAMFKIANDIRLLSSGPRAGLNEISIPENEPGSSIMPGKVNPTQCEAITMIATKVIGNAATVSFAGSQGHFELNVYKPVMIYSNLQSMKLLTDGINSFVDHCLDGAEANLSRINELMNKSLMLVTALNPHIGYDKAAKIAKNAHKKGISLKESALELGFVTEEEFNKYIDPKKMI
jgi:fumarate hydratase class II